MSEDPSLDFESTDFFTLLRALEHRNPDRPRIGESSASTDEYVKLGQEPHVEYSVSNVTSAEQREDGKLFIQSRFLGLLGPHGALPLHTSYEAAHWRNMRDPAFARFLDLFNNRFQQLFYRAWANAHMVPQAERPRDNQFISYLGSIIGIGTSPNQNRDSLHEYTKLSVAGLLGSSVKSAARIERYIAWLFKAKVNIQQFVGVWLPLDIEEQTALGKGNCTLGSDCLAGKSAFSLSDKFRIRLQVADLAEFEAFLPDGENFKPMADAVAFYIGNTLLYDVEIGMSAAKAKPVTLGQFGRLGWTSWMNPQSDAASQDVRWDCRFHPTDIVNLASV